MLSFNRPLLIITLLVMLIIILFRPFLAPADELKLKIGWLEAIRDSFTGKITAIMPEDCSGLLNGLLLGKAASKISEETKEDFKKTGTVHLLVVSGMQVSLLIGICQLFFKKFNRWIGFFASSFFSLFFILAVGTDASVVRAGIMAEVALIGKLFNRESDGLTLVAASALPMLIFDPLVLFNLGFQLSFAATAALIWLVPKMQEKVKWPEIVVVSTAPIILSAPIILYNFNQFSPIALFANIILLPWINYLVIFGFLAAVLGFMAMPLAQIFGLGLMVILKLLNILVSFMAGLPFSSVYLPAPHFIFVVFYYIVVIMFFNNMIKISFKKTAAIALLLAVFWVWSAALSPAETGLTAVFLDVGQGDSIFIETPDSKKILIDGGGMFNKQNMGKRVVLPFLRQKGINKLDLVVLTHPHDDHLRGLVSVLNDFAVDAVLDSGQIHTSQSYQKFLKAIDRKKIKYVLARAGQTMEVGKGVWMRVLNPSEPLIDESALNNNSVVIKLTYGQVSFLLMGDAESEAEERMFQEGNLQADLIKIGHHGSRTASSLPFLEAVNPKIAVISCGKENQFKHPHVEVLERLESLGIKCLRTDQKGTITVKTDGKYVIINP
ncbi:DNA internalization-related competence protein ComEC/Rec2 [candidate division WOR-1 bacterium RIFOXYA12_FULL_43_27]|uniref:DNA internalization-related competence protein ComEC/Rec2 n=1 Tax=candidate division WOR-1 bacterium RIFOXYC2_FULL_46_14 TaxID=1802587 RepID=A0A1F4U609_UNCSA|nr:MAG: DNA internalization-related competence protein ComEC/Rec2 [candidate division WOR-1 bacterium RIFOXYA12_FULL_43_27]OGC20563.1 MAG: DNA internalization-related competence protein ComEC/Rec2 [candidate division WOR-1 bacterium RIFOXYB2_FULL_46_45]OGC31700.1 MAG: DNA internalization-related competence protein ComEC/Rec2 [candidate division WOR-1 bacterium RIFOXYA2_FULL_46_56]OGC40405.1 MAG: DNA internalization-related competence protein ComEC/Rec2 [candidate division WOR-1 bacterium RIFOXYC